MEELIQAIQEGERAAIVFVAQRGDAIAFTPNDAADPTFGQALREAVAAGLEVYAYACRVGQDEVTLDRAIPVILKEQHLPKPAVCDIIALKQHGRR